MRRLLSNFRSLPKSELVLFLVTIAATITYQQASNWNTLPPTRYHLTLDSSTVDQFDEVLVIGDVHGCYDELQLLLRVTNASGENVLKILLGDFMSRGPKSLEVLDYVKNTPSVLAVRGNHDDIVLREYFDSKTTGNYERNENWFVRYLSVDDVLFISSLPYTISIPSLNAIMVHGGLIPSLPLEYHSPKVMTHLRNLKLDGVTGEICALGTPDEGVPWASMWRGPQHIYFGHDHPRNMQLYPFATGIDTSCLYGDYLTGIFIKGPRTGQFNQMKAFGVYFTAPPEDPLKVSVTKCLQ